MRGHCTNSIGLRCREMIRLESSKTVIKKRLDEVVVGAWTVAGNSLQFRLNLILVVQKVFVRWKEFPRDFND